MQRRSTLAASRFRTLLVALIGLSASGLGVAACGDDETATSGITGSTTTSSGGAGGAGQGVTTSSALVSVGSGGGTPCDLHCSTDLHSIIDCNDVLVETCPDDQGCGEGGVCVPACDAATDNASTFGCDFYSVTPAIINEVRGSCFAVLVANTWTSNVDVQASYDGQTIDVAQYLYRPQGQGAALTYQPTGGTLAAGELGVLFLSKFESGDVFQTDCPVPQALEMRTQLDGTGRGQAFHVTTTRPVVGYDVYPWGGASSFATSATLLVPTPTWGDNFVTADAWVGQIGNPFTQVVGSQDDTVVTIVPTANIQAGGTLPAMPANVPSTFTIDQGEVVQFLQPGRLAGSIVSSDKPISIWGGSSCMNIPDGTGACDGAHQQLLPVQILGNQYAGVRYPSRGGNDSAPYTVVGMVDGTQLSYDPAAPMGAPSMLNRGDVVVFSTDQTFVVTSQDADHPYYLAAHMTGGGTSGGLGDPEYVNVVSTAQYLPFYLFATDPTYSDTSLVFVRGKAADDTFKDVTLDCAGALTGWQPLGASGEFEYLQFKMVENGASQLGCENGVHTAESETPFALTVWGYDQYASYAYPAGMAVETINSVVIPPTPN